MIYNILTKTIVYSPEISYQWANYIYIIFKNHKNHNKN